MFKCTDFFTVNKRKNIWFTKLIKLINIILIYFKLW